jgi:hypothetical protein
MLIANDYDTWYAGADSLMTLAHGFYDWAPFPIPDELAMLEELINIVEPPPEFEPEPDYDDWRDGSAGVYWTIERMFEDL